MARCDEGYLCEVCGEEVEDLTDSDLYLRYVLGDVEPERLHLLPERHLRCNPALATIHHGPAISTDHGERRLRQGRACSDFVAGEESRVTAGYRRLHEVLRLGLPIHEYPLPQASLQREDPAS